ncbi:hypothetical protein EDD18DRAFT_1101943 [Armillaria luteobubalina]|uniref:Uncharacterized protein n=1 Tax=Armillaria luteobubalina TaxID=153913 RepID=A0AA39QG13_9AGAR|nr:hypothetical protein EDD18DRAFT_1101943 [Armillaria luteobubalina]
MLDVRVTQEKSMEGSLAEVAFTIKHYYITTSRTDSFGANISWARIMVSQLRREDADEAYESYMDARVAGGSSSGTDKASTVRTVVSVVDTKDEVEVEEESVRKRKSKGVSSDRSPKKAKTSSAVSVSLAGVTKSIFDLAHTTRSQADIPPGTAVRVNRSSFAHVVSFLFFTGRSPGLMYSEAAGTIDGRTRVAEVSDSKNSQGKGDLWSDFVHIKRKSTGEAGGGILTVTHCLSKLRRIAYY